MTNVIQTKHSTTTGNAPTALETGELAVNIADKAIFVGDASNSPVKIVSPSSFYQGTVTGGALTKVAGTVVVTRTSVGVYEVTASATDAIIVNVAGGTLTHLTCSEVTGTATVRRFHIHDAEKLGRPLADPASILVTVIV